MTQKFAIDLDKQCKVFSAIERYHYCDEDQLITEMLDNITLSNDDKVTIQDDAKQLVEQLRSSDMKSSLVDDLLQEYGLSNPEGIALMRLSEALVRTPDAATATLLIRDKLINGDWSSHAGNSSSFMVNSATKGLQFSKFWARKSGGNAPSSAVSQIGDTILHNAMKQGMRYMGNHFVLGRSIEEAIEKSAGYDANITNFSYDMLGEAAYTNADAQRYFEAYEHAVQNIANNGPYNDVRDAPSISVKLSALHPRYEITHTEEVLSPILDKLLRLCTMAKAGNFGITIDAEESERLEISLMLVEQLCAAEQLAQWDGLSIVIQAYQKRALPVIEHIISLSTQYDRKLMVRLVKGAYWDSEIKRAQEMGLSDYPVFTRKENSDTSYIACAQALLVASDHIFSQFATHNAHTAISVANMAMRDDKAFELQRLHGMGDQLHILLAQKYGVKSRIYAPVGPHKDLLPYLVRRLLENGANSSFVNQLSNNDISIDNIIKDPTILSRKSLGQKSNLPSPQHHLSDGRVSAKGFDWNEIGTIKRLSEQFSHPPHIDATSYCNGMPINGDKIERFSPFDTSQKIGEAQYADINAVNDMVSNAKTAQWHSNYDASSRAKILRNIADNLLKQENELLNIIIWEAGKTVADALAEVREAVDFCRYYADQAEKLSDREPLGIVACISPWNFPLAIYLGQIVAALSMGNTVIAKPAEQTPLIAYKIYDLMLQSGVPKEAFHLLIGDGAKLGNALTSHQDIAAICFTGSTRTAKQIARNLANTQRADIPFIAETGGINAMIVDSTALMEQVIEDVLASAFQSAGQRCSACRLVCIQEDVADDFIKMLRGAMENLHLGATRYFSTDVGPVIDEAARNNIMQHVDTMNKVHKDISGKAIQNDIEKGYFVVPQAFEIDAISDLKQEIFGPVLHIKRFKAHEIEDVIEQINALGYGLTMGFHTRIDARAQQISKTAKVGNLYINRNQIGAVVGVQPFGGEGLSGTGPKAGGPHYLKRLSHREQTVLSPHIAQEDHDYFLEEYELPGPTGENNSLSLHPRGTILCLGGDDKQALYRQVCLAHTAGNQIITLDAFRIDIEANNALSNNMNIIYEDVQNIDASLNESNHQKLLFHAVACDGKRRLDIATKIALMDGAIMPILSAYDDIDRYAIERCITIDTTAAGGNATLLAGL